MRTFTLHCTLSREPSILSRLTQFLGGHLAAETSQETSSATGELIFREKEKLVGGTLRYFGT